MFNFANEGDYITLSSNAGASSAVTPNWRALFGSWYAVAVPD